MGWRSEPEVSIPCSECLISQTAPVITAAQPAAGVSPNWYLQGVTCATLWLRGGPEVTYEMTHTGGKGRALVAFGSTPGVDLPTRNQKVKWIPGHGKGTFVSDSRDWEIHFSL